MKKMKYIAVLLMTAMTAAGCGNEIPQMSKQEQDIITEYAAATFLEYSGEYENKLLIEVKETASEEESAQVEAEKEETIEKETAFDADKEITQADVPTISENTSTSAVVASVPMAQFLGADNFSIDYEGYEICDSYSGAAEGEIAFGMEASAGKKLMIVKFNVSNLTLEEQILDVFSKNVKAKVGAADLNKSALLTMLENDLLTANVTFGSNESKTFVIVIEVPKEKESDITEVTLELNYGGNQAKYTF